MPATRRSVPRVPLGRGEIPELHVFGAGHNATEVAAMPIIASSPSWVLQSSSSLSYAASARSSRSPRTVQIRAELRRRCVSASIRWREQAVDEIRAGQVLSKARAR